MYFFFDLYIFVLQPGSLTLYKSTFALLSGSFS